MAASVPLQKATSPFKKILQIALGVLIGIVLLILIVMGFKSFHTVPTGHIGVVRGLDGVEDTTLDPGTHFVKPWKHVYDFNTQVQSVTAKDANGGTIDLQQVYENLTLNYSFDPAHVASVFREFGTDNLDDNFIFPAMVEAFKAVTSKYTAEDLVTKRADFSQAVISQLQLKLNKYHINVSDINVTEFRFDKAFSDAVEQKVVAAQQRLTAEQTLETAKISAQQRIVEAESQAKAIAIQAQAIQQQGGADYVKLQAINKWNGSLPQYTGGAIPFVNAEVAGTK